MNTHWYFGILISLCLVFLYPADKTSGASYPERPITIIVPFAPGGTVDMSIRPLADAAKQILGKPIVLEYHSGGSSAVGLGILKNKKADGYTLGLCTQSSLIGQNITKVPYDLLKDFDTIIGYSDVANGIVIRAKFPLENLERIIGLCQSQPQEGPLHLCGPWNSQRPCDGIYSQTPQGRMDACSL